MFQTARCSSMGERADSDRKRGLIGMTETILLLLQSRSGESWYIELQHDVTAASLAKPFTKARSHTTGDDPPYAAILYANHRTMIICAMQARHDLSLLPLLVKPPATRYRTLVDTIRPLEMKLLVT